MTLWENKVRMPLVFAIRSLVQNVILCQPQETQKLIMIANHSNPSSLSTVFWHCADGCRQNGNEVSVSCTFGFQDYPLILALACVGVNDHAENFWLPPTMARPKAFFTPCFFLFLYRTRLAASAALCICCACLYTNL